MIGCSFLLVYSVIPVCFHDDKIFFLLLFVASKNGQVVGTVFKEMKGPLFPTVAVHSQNEEYVVLLFFSSSSFNGVAACFFIQVLYLFYRCIVRYLCSVYMCKVIYQILVVNCIEFYFSIKVEPCYSISTQTVHVV